MIRIILTLAGALTAALAALTFSAATAHACGTAGNGFADCPDLPTNIHFATAFVEAVGPTFFEPWASVGL
jgi:F0F1-type ATP synthase membrane subunit c/vacuolar-type H+-ATPase subunit K